MITLLKEVPLESSILNIVLYNTREKKVSQAAGFHKSYILCTKSKFIQEFSLLS